MRDKKKKHWSQEEDLCLIKMVSSYGEGQWNRLAEAAGLQRCGKSCRLRWLNYLRPGVKHGCISEAERRRIIHLYQAHGGRWSLIAAHLPGRSDNEIKNYWRCHIRKKEKSGYPNFTKEETYSLCSSPFSTHSASMSSTTNETWDDQRPVEVGKGNFDSNILDFDNLPSPQYDMVTPLMSDDDLSWDMESTFEIVGHLDMDDFAPDLQFDHLWSNQ